MRGLLLRTRQQGEGRARTTGSRVGLIRHTPLRLSISVSVPAGWQRLHPGGRLTPQKIVKTQTEIPCSRIKKTAAKKSVETQTEVLCMHERIADAKTSVETQTEAPTQDASMQVTGCHECQSLAFAVPADGGSTCRRRWRG